MEIAADDDRTALALATSDRTLVILDHGKEKWSWAMRETVTKARCGIVPRPMLGYVSVGMSTDGAEAWFLGMDGSKTPPHRTLTASCLVDTQSGQVRDLGEALTNPDAFDEAAIERRGMPSIALSPKVAALWNRSGGIELVRRAERRREQLAVGARDGKCVVTIDGAELVVGCLASSKSGLVRLLRFELAQSPAKLLASWEVDTGLRRAEVQLSPGGKLLAVFEDVMPSDGTSGLALIETEAGSVVLRKDMQPRIRNLELSPATGTMLVAVDWGLQRWSLKGTLLESLDIDWFPQALLLTAKGDELWSARRYDLRHYDVRWTASQPR